MTPAEGATSLWLALSKDGRFEVSNRSSTPSGWEMSTPFDQRATSFGKNSATAQILARSGKDS